MCYFYIKVFSATIARRMLIVTMPFRTAVASTSHVRVTLAIMGRIRALSVLRVCYVLSFCDKYFYRKKDRKLITTLGRSSSHSENIQSEAEII